LKKFTKLTKSGSFLLHQTQLAKRFQMNPSEKTKLKIGPYEICPLPTGIFGLDGGAMFGTVPKVLWEKSNPPDDKNRISIACPHFPQCDLLRSTAKSRNSRETKHP
jgi:hypothetical protein